MVLVQEVDDEPPEDEDGKENGAHRLRKKFMHRCASTQVDIMCVHWDMRPLLDPHQDIFAFEEEG